jgi:hypothetical protein
LVYCDLIGPFPQSPAGNAYGFVVVCAATKWVEVVPLARIDAVTVLGALEGLIWRHGAPATVWSDEGSQLLGVSKLNTPAYSHVANGICERAIKTLKAMLKASMAGSASHDDWEACLPRVLFSMRAVLSESMGFSPFALMYGRKPVHPTARALRAELIPREPYAMELGA